MGEAIIRKRIRFTGWVQGVGFRWRAEHAAARTGVSGWVSNEYDGSVLMEIQGKGQAIDDTVGMIAAGTWVRIEGMDVKTIPVDPDESGFRVL